MPTLACGVVTDGLHVRAYGSVSFLVVQRFVLICCVYRVFGRVSSFVSVFFVLFVGLFVGLLAACSSVWSRMCVCVCVGWLKGLLRLA